MKSRLRYLFPNLVTAASIGFGVIAIERAIVGRFWSAVWWALYSTMADKLDGTIARRLNASSGFGLQLDSLADFVSFGVAPATIVYAFFVAHPEVGWSTGAWRWALQGIMVAYVLCAAARLARFNVVAANDDRLFFGFPTTFTFATLGSFFALLLKYGNPGWITDESRFDWRTLGALRIDSAMRLFPLLMMLGAIGMVSNLRVPKMGRRLNVKVLDGYVYVSAVVVYVAGIFRVLPELVAAVSVTYVIGAVVFHFVSPTARAAKLPPLFT